MQSLGKNHTEGDLGNNTSLRLVLWIVPTAADVVCMVVALWIFVSFLCYGIAHKKFTRNRNFGRMPYISACFASFSTWVYLVVRIASYNVGYTLRSNKACAISTIVSVELYCISTSSVFWFLWVKQHYLYKSPVLEQLNKGWVTILSYVSIFFMLVGLNAAAITINVLHRYDTSPYGCERTDKFFSWPFATVSILTATGQFVLLLLFAYPFLCSHPAPKYSAGLRILKRTFAVSLFCIITDLFTGMFNTFVPFKMYRIQFVAYPYNATVNLIGVALTFETWKKLLQAPYTKPKFPRCKNNTYQ